MALDALNKEVISSLFKDKEVRVYKDSTSQSVIGYARSALQTLVASH